MMQIRVRGNGGSSENSQAVLMNLRGFRQNIRPDSPLAEGSFFDFVVKVSCGGCSFKALWNELWNLYDIAFDECTVLSLDPSAPPVPRNTLRSFICVSHVVDDFPVAKGNVSVLSVVVDLRSATTSRPFCDAQKMAWLLAFASLLKPSHTVALLEEEGEFSVERTFITQFMKNTTVIFATSKTLAEIPRSGDVPLLCTDEEALQESRIQFAADHKLHIHPVPVSEAAIALADDTTEEDRRENSRLNFCPCCGHTGPCH